MRAMLPYMEAEFGNPSSDYAMGRRAKQAVETARRQVASLVHGKPHEIVFTSGGSESNNMVLKGIVDFKAPEKSHIITSAIEHPAVLNPAAYLMELGVDVTVLPVDNYGQVDPGAVKKALRPDTSLISIMLANNETGTLQPLEEITAVGKTRGIPVHTDAAQAVGKIPVDVNALGVDFLTVAGHKLYGPKGMGALYMRNRKRLSPLIHGGRQEAGIRSGTENVMLAVCLGAACRAAETRLDADMAHAKRLRDRLQTLLFEGLEGLVLNGHPTDRLPNTLNVSIPNTEGGKILKALPILMASTGAACHDRTVNLSHVLSAMDVPPNIGMGALRFSVGRNNAMAEIETAAELIIDQARRMCT